MSGVQRRMDRLRARSRRADIGVDDGRGAMADAPPAPVVGDQAVPPRRHGPVQVPRGLEVAAAWSWRVILVAILLAGICWLIAFFAVLVVPLAVALLITALIIPGVELLQRVGVPRGLATALVVVALLAFITGALTLVGQQLATQFDDLADQVVAGIEEIENWLKTGPLDLSQAQLTDAVASAREALASGDQPILSRVTSVGTTVGHAVAGFFLALFALIFFLYDGARIWRWVVRLLPAGARRPVDGAGRAAWVSLTSFVRATVLVAFVDAVGITAVALILQVPLALPIGVLVFLSSFIPIIGATLSGAVAVLVALVAHGPVVALIMLAGVIAVQQLESHVLQPLLLGHAVRLHPLAVIVAIAAGALTAGIVGALIAVPFAAVVNTATRHLVRAGSDPEPAGSSP